MEELENKNNEISASNSPRGEKKYQLSRRKFLRAAGLISTGVGIGSLVEACVAQQNQAAPENIPVAIPATGQYEGVPEPSMVPPPDTLQYLTPAEAKTVDAIASRLIPGSPDDPGAHEADVLNFIDKALTFRKGVTSPTYAQPPFAKAYEGDQPPQSAAKDKSVVFVKKSELERYGFQSSLNPQQIYRKGLAELQKYTNQKYGGNFETLSPEVQDQILEDLEDDKVTGFSEPSAKTFFNTIYDDTINGFFSDPGYGGNKGMVGWKLIQYPGAQRAYPPEDMHDEAHIRPPQDLAMLHDFHPGQPSNPDVIIPPAGVSGLTH